MKRSRVRSAGWRLTMNRSMPATSARDAPSGGSIGKTRFMVRSLRKEARKIPICAQVSSPVPASSPWNPTRISLNVMANS